MVNGSQRKRNFNLVTYALIAGALYILYLIMQSKPRPSSGVAMEFPGMPVPGELPVLNLDKLPGGKALIPDLPAEVDNTAAEQESPPGGALTPAQKQMLLEILPSMGRLVHLDLKGAAPKVSYLKEIFPLLKTLGATGLLIEWEDMFPYDGDLEVIAATDCYSKDDVKEMLALAKANDLMVIPLIQTFGHMEFVLKGEKFKHLREHPMQPQVINPHKPESLDLIKKMVDQQLALQPDIEHLHIGLDEVWGLGNSPESKQKMETYGMTKDTLFLDHVREVAGHIKNTYPHVEIMMWDDMFRNAKTTDIERSRVNRLVTPVVWKYTKDVDRAFSASLWHKYGKLFRGVWFGSAFKGATGSDQILTDINYHYENHMGWLRILANLVGSMDVRGIMFTGWQRYDHFGSLCELLPVAIPSLAVCLSAMQNVGVSKSNLKSINGLLECQPQSPIQWTLDTKDRPAPLCSYPGHRLLEGAYELKNAQFYVNFFNSKQSLAGWHKDYNMDRNFVQNFRINYLLEKCNKALEHLTAAETIMAEHIPKYFSEETKVEWLATNIDPIKQLVINKKAQIDRVLKLDTWPRRPIHKAVSNPRNLLGSL